jgi:hypothetical protein
MATRTISAQNFVSVTALIWLGMLLGVSFLATPVKFLAPSLSLPVALDVGRQTFAVFSVVEVIVLFILLSASWLSGRRRRLMSLSFLIGCLMAVQFFWLLPALDARVEIILQGGAVPESSLHNLYIVIDSAKLLMLSIVCWSARASAFVSPVPGVAENAR